MDGFGLAPPGPGNAISLARTPNLDHYMSEYPCTELAASGLEVGLPPGEMGNSETGHMNFGAGRTVYQKLTLISKMIEDGTFFDTPAFTQAIEHVRRNNSRLHLIGLIGPGGVHAYEGHLDALLTLARDAGLRHVYVQAILDGRDTEPRSALGYVRDLNARMEELQTGEIATTSGRYYAMDRDKRWDRTERAYRAMAQGIGPTATSAEEAVQAGYNSGLGDEHQLPTVIVKEGQPVAMVQVHDAVIFFNFRGDRPRQLTRAFVLPEFDGFDRGPRIDDLFFVTLAEYEQGLPVVVAFPPERLSDPVTAPLALVLSASGLRQLHVAETEKYAHVTYFLNGGREEPFPGEDRVLVPSPKVATYDLQPEMSAAGVADAVVDGLASQPYAFDVVNFANCDMVGHTGDIPATVKAVETVDTQLKRVVDATLAQGGVALITADHGNAETMLEPGGGPWTAHTSNPVPFVLVAADSHPELKSVHLRDGGKLGDVSPTILYLLGLPQPDVMTGRCLIEE
jgi:2,3-bisphosphoglycerate-independent phosphoglycerate mutase